MAISEKLYELRKQKGLSQEQLAEQLNVSRQAISKWESGQSNPEYDKLIALSDYFGVSLDCLMKDEPETQSAEKSMPESKPDKRTAGLIFCIGGILCMILLVLISALSPSAAEQIEASSTISIDGNGIFFICCAAVTVFGAVLFLKNPSEK